MEVRERQPITATTTVTWNRGEGEQDEADEK